MKRDNKKFLWMLIGGFVLMVFASLFFGDAMESLQKFIGARASQHADSSKNAAGVIGFIVTIAGGIISYLGIAGLCSSNKGTPLKPNHTLRVFLATLACGGVFFLNSAIGALITGGKGHGGLLGILVLFAVIGWVWRAIVGDSSARPGGKAKPEKEEPNARPENVVHAEDPVRPAVEAPIHNYANEYIGKRFEVKSDDGRFIIDEPVTSPITQREEKAHETLTPAPLPNVQHEPSQSSTEPVATVNESTTPVLGRRSEGMGDYNLGGVIAGGLLIVIIIGVLVAVSSLDDSPTSKTTPSGEVAAPDISDEFSEVVEPVEKSSETKKKVLSLEERAKLITVCDDKRELPVEMLHESGWSPSQSNEVKHFSTFWGVPFGMVVTEATDKANDWYWAFGNIKYRYSFEPASKPGEIDYFNFSVTPVSHKVWRIASIAKCQTLREALDEVGRMRKRMNVHKVSDEYFATDGAWVIYTSNTNRTIEVRVEEEKKNEIYWVYAEAYDNRLAQTLENEGVSPDEDMRGLFGVNFGETVDGGSGFTADPNNRSWYDFTPAKRFRTFKYFDVYVTPRSHTICKIRAQRQFSDNDAANAEAHEVLEIFRTKYPGVPFKERTDLKEGWKEWVFTFRPKMEFQRTLEITKSPENYVFVTAIADSDYFDLYNRERYQDDVDKLKADVDSL